MSDEIALQHEKAVRLRPHRRTVSAGLGADFDRDPGIATRQHLLERLTTGRIPIIGFRIAWPGFGVVERSGPAYRFIPL
jgi:hypothetical protein